MLNPCTLAEFSTDFSTMEQCHVFPKLCLSYDYLLTALTSLGEVAEQSEDGEGTARPQARSPVSTSAPHIPPNSDTAAREETSDPLSKRGAL